MYIDKLFPNIKKSDLEVLISNKVAEGKEIDYKEIYLMNSDKKELCKDISAFANNSGGYIIYGMKEIETYPTEISSFALEIDKVKQQINSIVMDGIKPRVQLEIKEIEIERDSYCLIIKIHNSYNKPHMVVYNKDNRFYQRNANGTTDMLDVDQIRNLVLSPDKLRKEIDSFIRQRRNIIKKQFPLAPGEYPVFCVHIIPVESFLNGKGFDLKNINHDYNEVAPIFADRPQSRKFNFEGIIFQEILQDKLDRYIQIFRNATIESAGTLINFARPNEKIIFVNEIEKYLFKYINDKLKLLEEKLQVSAPYILHIAIYNIKDYFNSSVGFYLMAPQRISKTDLIFPEIYLEQKPENITLTLKPTLDLLWNELGYSESPSYKTGEWVEVK